MVASAQGQALPERVPLTFDAPLRAETVYAQASPEEWPTEVWQTQVRERLNGLFENPKIIPNWVSESITLTDVRPLLTKVYDDGEYSVHRPEPSHAVSRARGRKALAEQLAIFDGPAIHLKIVDLQPEASGDSFMARVLIEMDAVAPPWTQQRLEWETQWTKSLQLIGIRSRFFEDVRSANGKRWFLDRTADVFADAPAFHQQLAHGIDDWRGRLESGLAPTITGFYGLALGDADGDGRDDLFVCQPHGLPNRLFLKKPNGTLVEAADSAVLNVLDATSSALFFDSDHDGDQDLIVAGDGFFIYHVNDGSGRFKRAQAIPLEGTVTSLAAADFDLDGRVDVYLCGHTSISQKDQDTPLGLPVPIHDANNGQANVLFRNTANDGFVDVTAEVGLDVNNQRFSYAAAWDDYDQDGDFDLYVANDFGRNNLYRNDRTGFEDVADELGVEDTGSGMSVSWGDVNGDGWMDLYHTFRMV
jgi:hypothetical protein